MKIAIIGPGAMGSIYGALLSQKHEVYLIGRNEDQADAINRYGITLLKEGIDSTYHPIACTSTNKLMHMDLVILFVKAHASEVALRDNQHIIGPETYLLTLQNGSGHEELLKKFTSINRIIIGTTEDSGTILSPRYVRRGGTGVTNLGMLVEDTHHILTKLKTAFDPCDLEVKIHSNIQQLIWNKLFINSSLSALTGVLQVPMGTIVDNDYAWKLAEALIHEAVDVAHGLGLEADEVAIKAKVHQTATTTPEGLPSICVDLKNGNRTEVDTISGSVVRASKSCGIPAPTHEFVVNLIHTMESLYSIHQK